MGIQKLKSTIHRQSAFQMGFVWFEIGQQNVFELIPMKQFDLLCFSDCKFRYVNRTDGCFSIFEWYVRCITEGASAAKVRGRPQYGT
jgi:hypothetical protein